VASYSPRCGILKEERSTMSIPRTLFNAAIVAFAAGIAATARPSPQESLKRMTLQTGDFPPGYETVMVVAQMEPGQCSGWHTHPGLESSYFLEGEVLMKFADGPDRVIRAGQPVLIPPGLAHNDCNVSGRPFKALAHYIVEKGRPLASPVAAP
jgi:quercetin dioxygenase-like cupin family protein